jgi:very-short-patch-repair endonuclease
VDDSSTDRSRLSRAVARGTTVDGVHRPLARVVTRQGGVFTRQQALECYSVAEVRSHLRRRTWRRTPWPGLYADGELPDDIPTLIRAASLWVGGDLVACHSTAALIWGFDLRSTSVALEQPLHFLGPPDLDNRALSGLRIHPSSLGTDDAVLQSGVWCTPPARTACDVGRLGPPIDVLASLDAALRAGVCTRKQLVEACGRQRGLRGVVLLHRLIPVADGRAESPMESRMRWRFIEAGLPAPELQVEVAEGARLYRLDTGWREHRVGAEFDGLEAHMTRQQLAADRARHNWLTERDWRLLHFTAIDVFRRWEAMVATVRRYLNDSRPTIMA